MATNWNGSYDRCPGNLAGVLQAIQHARHLSQQSSENKEIFKDEPLQEVKTEAKEEPPTSPRGDAALPPLREHTDDEDNASLSSAEEIWLDEGETDEENEGGIKEEEEEELSLIHI